jgi:hypothetical protein
MVRNNIIINRECLIIERNGLGQIVYLKTPKIDYPTPQLTIFNTIV